jgi:hypothetical protein
MKRIPQLLFAALFLIVVFSGCMAMRPITGPAGPPQADFIGTWALNTVTFSRIVESDVKTAFDQAPPKDFIGSTWELTNNGTGKYTLANGTSQNISWAVNGGDALGAIFLFKKVNSGQSPENVALSYQLVISNNSQTTITLKTLVYLGNKNGYVVYTFSKLK